MLVEPSGDLVVVDGGTSGSRLLRVHPQDGSHTTLARGVTTQSAVWRDVETDLDGGFLVVDSLARAVIRVDDSIPFDPNQPGANQSTWAACPGFLSPRGIARGSDGKILVSDFSARKVFRIDPTANPPCTEVPTGGLLVGPWDVAVAPELTPFDPTPLLVADSATDKIYRVDPEDGSSLDLWPALSFVDPVAVTRDLNGDYLVLETNSIQRVTPGGVKSLAATITPGAGDLPVALAGIAVDADGVFLVTDGANDRVLRVDPGTGGQSVIADDDFATPSRLGAPAGVALDRNGMLLLANGGDMTDDPTVATGLVRVNPVSGAVDPVVSDAQFGQIVDVALDLNGDYLISDRGAKRVWRFRASTPGSLILYPVSIDDKIVTLRGLAVDVNRSVVAGNQRDQGASDILRMDPTNGVQVDVTPQLDFAGIQDVALDVVPTPAPLDSDGDGHLEAADNCPELSNPDQLDTDGDGAGDVCDLDDDGDGDPDTEDNCRLVANPQQTDSNQDGYGNLCDGDFTGAGSGSLGDGVVNALDLGEFKAAYLSQSGQPRYDAAIDLDSDGAINAVDLGIFRGLFLRPAGPSGYTCAGSPPCPLP
jgi:sugar lactone lactonase YvrE